MKVTTITSARTGSATVHMGEDMGWGSRPFCPALQTGARQVDPHAEGTVNCRPCIKEANARYLDVEHLIQISSRVRNLIKAVREHAVANYDTGAWDIIVEAFSDSELAGTVGKCRTAAGAIAGRRNREAARPAGPPRQVDGDQAKQSRPQPRARHRGRRSVVSYRCYPRQAVVATRLAEAGRQRGTTGRARRVHHPGWRAPAQPVAEPLQPRRSRRRAQRARNLLDRRVPPPELHPVLTRTTPGATAPGASPPDRRPPMRTFSLSLIEEALDGTDTTRNDYFGRGMYGDACAAIVVQSFADAAMFAFDLGELTAWCEDATDEEAQEAVAAEDLIRAIRFDNMGHDIVAYFPGWTFA
jgi:hypothetical protein